jgi:LacI family transcriptional regulator
MSDVARLAGVHKGTASRALNPDTAGQVNGATAQRVQAAARRLAYVPNAAARSLRTHRSHTVGVLIPDLTNPLFPPIVRGIEDVLAEAGYTALIANTDNDEERERDRFEALRGRQVDGFVLATARREHALLERALADGTRVVLVNRSTDRRLFSSVVADDAGGVADAITHLVGLGHRRIAHLAGPATVSTGAIRASAFRRCVKTRGLSAVDCRVVSCLGYSEVAGRRAMADLLDGAAPPTAVLCGNDLIALGALRALRERGIACPRAVSVVGFNDMPFMDEVQPALTTVRVPHHDLGAQAARLLLDQLDGRPAAKLSRLPVELVVRGSTSVPSGMPLRRRR